MCRLPRTQENGTSKIISSGCRSVTPFAARHMVSQYRSSAGRQAADAAADVKKFHKTFVLVYSTAFDEFPNQTAVITILGCGHLRTKRPPMTHRRHFTHSALKVAEYGRFQTCLTRERFLARTVPAGSMRRCCRPGCRTKFACALRSRPPHALRGWQVRERMSSFRRRIPTQYIAAPGSGRICVGVLDVGADRRAQDGWRMSIPRV